MLFLELPPAVLHLGDQLVVPLTRRAAPDRQLRQRDPCRCHPGPVFSRRQPPWESTQQENARCDVQPASTTLGFSHAHTRRGPRSSALST
jgi:hypothetical protein